MKKFMIAASIVASFALVACGGGGDSCTATSKCSADPKSTEAEIKACQEARKTAKCVAEGDALTTCALGQQVCGTDNKTDGVKTNEGITKNCATQLAAAVKCALDSADAGQ